MVTWSVHAVRVAMLQATMESESASSDIASSNPDSSTNCRRFLRIAALRNYAQNGAASDAFLRAKQETYLQYRMRVEEREKATL